MRCKDAGSGRTRGTDATEDAAARRSSAPSATWPLFRQALALHLAPQGGQREAVETLLELGPDATLRDALHDGTPSGWAEFGCHRELAALLEQR